MTSIAKNILVKNMPLNNFSISNLKLINFFQEFKCKRTKRLEDYDNETMIQQKKKLKIEIKQMLNIKIWQFQEKFFKI